MRRIAYLLVLAAAACDGAPTSASNAAPSGPPKTPPAAKSDAPAAKAEPSAPTPTPEETKPEPAAEPEVPAVEWKINATPNPTKLSDLGDLRITVVVTNNGSASIAPDRGFDFKVDGARSQALSLAFGNGGRGKEWTTLEAGKTATNARVGVLFTDTAGEHVISLESGGKELARTTIRLE